MTPLKLMMVQLNPAMGALDANAARMAEWIQAARAREADLVVFPELALCGYPPEDLLLTDHFLSDTRAALDRLAAQADGLEVVTGFAYKQDGRVYNAAAWLKDGRVHALYAKVELPNYGVFDEKRYFYPGDRLTVADLKGCRVALSICEDLWVPEGAFEGYLKREPVDLVLNLSASPFYAGKLSLRRDILSDFARRRGLAVAYCNLVGGQDELVFDGGSMFLNPRGEVMAEARRFAESACWLEVGAAGGSWSCTGREVLLPSALPTPKAFPGAELTRVEEVYQALVLGTRDYVRKNGFSQAVIGLSGGIDSALTAVIARDALGPEKVIGVTMPSGFTSGGTLHDAGQLADNLGIRFLTVPIEPLFKVYQSELQGVLGEGTQGVAYENLQARIRGNILMALSNRFGWLVLTTGNKSEIATGYCTLYGDMAGGFAVIKDVPKTLVYALSEWVNQKAGRDVIPLATLQRAPSAELRPNQKDEDSLPPYARLDPILQAYVEEDRSPDDIIRLGFSRDMVMEVIRLVDKNEYKRRQAPPGVKITPKAFGRDRRLPITNQYRPQSREKNP